MVPFTCDDMEGEDVKPLSYVPRDAVYPNFEDEAFITVSWGTPIIPTSQQDII